MQAVPPYDAAIDDRDVDSADQRINGGPARQCSSLPLAFVARRQSDETGIEKQ